MEQQLSDDFWKIEKEFVEWELELQKKANKDLCEMATLALRRATHTL